MRTNYVLIDFENVQPNSLEILSHECFRVFVFVGANQSKLNFETAVAIQGMGSKAAYIKIEGNGPNALDFHIAYYIGKLAAEDPESFFHIISKDTGFDPLIRHLKAKGIFATRVKAIAEIPLVKASGTKSLEERLETVIGKFQQPKQSRPRTIKTLTNTLDSFFQRQLSTQEIERLIDALKQKGKISVTGSKVIYNLSPKLSQA